MVCVKQVPDANIELEFEAPGNLRRGEDDVINEIDENAIETAVSLAEDTAGEVIAITMGPQDAEAVLRRAIQMDCDAAYHVCDAKIAGTDVVGTAKVLASAVNKIAKEHGQVDLVVCGMVASDAMTGLLPGALAASLGWPAVTLVSDLKFENDKLWLERRADGYKTQIKVTCPIIISVTDQINEPRYPNFRAIAAARKKPLTTWQITDLEVPGFAQLGHEGAAMRIAVATRNPSKSPGQIVNDTGQGGQVIAQWLKDNNYLEDK